MQTDISEPDARHTRSTPAHPPETGVPRWYWWGLALAWVTLGLSADLANPWVTVAATLLFGAGHSAIAPHAFCGPHRSRRLSQRTAMANRHLPILRLGVLAGLAALTIGLGFLADADGARHPATMASIVVAVAIPGLGPNLTAAVRQRGEQHEPPLGQ